MDQHIVTAWAEEYARLEFRLADVITERDAYQQIVHAALDQLHSMTTALDRTRAQLYRLTEQVRSRRQSSLADTASEPGQPRTYTTKHGTEAARRRYRSVYRRQGPGLQPGPALEARP